MLLGLRVWCILWFGKDYRGSLSVKVSSLSTLEVSWCVIADYLLSVRHVGKLFRGVWEDSFPSTRDEIVYILALFLRLWCVGLDRTSWICEPKSWVWKVPKLWCYNERLVVEWVSAVIPEARRGYFNFLPRSCVKVSLLHWASVVPFSHVNWILLWE